MGARGSKHSLPFPSVYQQSSFQGSAQKWGEMFRGTGEEGEAEESSVGSQLYINTDHRIPKPLKVEAVLSRQ